MKRLDVRIVGGVLLIVAGVLALLQIWGVFLVSLDLFWAFLFGAGGVVFLSIFLTGRDHSWPLIPGFALLGLAATIALEQLAPQVGDTWGGALFLGMTGLAFWAIYFTNREHWWAIIPGGALLTLALVAATSSVIGEVGTGGVFFLGLGLTFGLLAFLPTPQGRIKWAIIPAGVLLALGLLVTAASATVLDYFWPVALILVGLYLVARVFLPAGSDRKEAQDG